MDYKQIISLQEYIKIDRNEKTFKCSIKSNINKLSPILGTPKLFTESDYPANRFKTLFCWGLGQSKMMSIPIPLSIIIYAESDSFDFKREIDKDENFTITLKSESKEYLDSVLEDICEYVITSAKENDFEDVTPVKENDFFEDLDDDEELGNNYLLSSKLENDVNNICENISTTQISDDGAIEFILTKMAEIESVISGEEMKLKELSDELNQAKLVKKINQIFPSYKKDQKIELFDTIYKIIKDRYLGISGIDFSSKFFKDKSEIDILHKIINLITNDNINI